MFKLGGFMQGEFNKDLDDYLSSRKGFTKKEPLFSSIKIPKLSFPKKKKKQTPNELFEDFEEFEDIEDDFEELEEPIKKSFSLFSFANNLFRRNRIVTEEDDIQEIQDILEINEEIKDVLRIQNEWLKKLSPTNLKNFKKSPEYSIYKATLEKYNLLKKED